MKIILILLAIACTVKFSLSAKVFSCDQGCHDDSECPTNSHCVAVNQNSECGMCLCKAGYKTSGNDCVPNGPQKSQKSGNGGKSKETTSAAGSTAASTAGSTTSASGGSNGQQSTAASTAAPADSTSASPATTVSTTQAGPTTQGPPPTPGPINCADYACGPSFPSSSDSDNPFTVRAALFNESDKCKNKLSNPGRPCKMQGGGTCYGVYCLTIEQGNDYCICEYNKVDRQCAVEKPGKCESASNQLPQTGYKAQNKRFRNKNSPENGSVYARHFAASLDDCVKLCTWTAGSCRSVNFGTLAGQQVCELLSTAVTKGSLLEPWLVDAQGWQYVQVVAQ